jgi:hypothetical protein
MFRLKKTVLFLVTIAFTFNTFPALSQAKEKKKTNIIIIFMDEWVMGILPVTMECCMKHQT